jgi:hypothetical protein
MPNDPRPRRQSLRLPGYDYSQAGAYFITVCTQNRLMLFDEVIDSDVRLNEMGMIVQQAWDDLPRHCHRIDLDAFIVMPAQWADDPDNITQAVAAERGRV